MTDQDLGIAQRAGGTVVVECGERHAVDDLTGGVEAIELVGSEEVVDHAVEHSQDDLRSGHTVTSARGRWP